MLFAFEVLVALFFPILLGIYWKKMTATAAFWSILMAGGFSITWTAIGSPFGLSSCLVSLPASFVLCVVISLLSKNSKSEEIDLFFTKNTA